MTACPHVERFESASVVLPALNETAALRQTVEIVLADAAGHIAELLVVVCARTTPAARTAVDDLRARYGAVVVPLEQRLPFLGGAYRTAFDAARGSHVLMMASDLETDPGDVKRLIAAAQGAPGAVVTATRWREGGAFHGYGRVKLACNWAFQRFFSFLYGVRLSDMTYGYRLLPTQVARAIAWEELRHPFNLESLLKPLRLGVPVVEVPSVWRRRTEGASSNSFLRMFAYLRTGLKTRFVPRRRLLKTPPGETAGREVVA